MAFIENGRLFLGLFVENGRVKDNIRAGIRAVGQQLGLEVRLTPRQHILFVNIHPADQAAIEATLSAHQIALPAAFPLAPSPISA